MAVVPVKSDTTCCIAVSYEGKACGVKTGTLVAEARRLCPGIKFIVGDHARVAAQKSLSHSHVLPPELRSHAGALRILKKLTDKAAGRLRAEGFYASRMSIYARFTGQDGWKADCVVAEAQDTPVFLNALRELWKGVPRGRPFAVGVVLYGLVAEALHAPGLFEDGRGGRLCRALDALNAKYGKEALHFGATHESAGLVPLRIAFTRIPEDSEL